MPWIHIDTSTGLYSFMSLVIGHFSKCTECYVQDCVSNDIYLVFMHLCSDILIMSEIRKMHGVLL